MEAVFPVRAEAPVHPRQLNSHELRPLGACPAPHVQVLEDGEATYTGVGGRETDETTTKRAVRESVGAQGPC